MNITPYTLALASLVPCTALAAEAEPNLNAAKALVKRVTPQFANKIQFKVKPSLKQPTIEGKGGKVLITGSCVRECIRAYGYYLRHMARIHFSWNGNNKSASRLVVPSIRTTLAETGSFNYAFNYCTLSYSTIHWDKARWEKELDQLALNGYQYVLVTSGLEKVWQGFLRELDYPEDKIKAFIPNPAFSAWWNMGNLEGEGGPISQTLIDSEAELGKFLVTRMKELGMEPVLQGYVGFLPHDFPQEGVAGTILPQGQWCHYERPAVLQPTSQAFPSIAALWYKHLHEVYGTTAKAYGGDLFHEGGNTGGTQLDAAAQAVQKAMQTASPGSKWLLQAWGGNPTRELLSGTDASNTVILALTKDLSPQSKLKKEDEQGNPFFEGRPYVWCELANFGGNHGLYGGFDLLEKLSCPASGAIGIGLLSEGIETNPLYYALLTERINNPDKYRRARFLGDYVTARYGGADANISKALNILAETVYKPDEQREGCLENIMCARPDLGAEKASTWSSPKPYYDPKKVEEAAKLFLQAGIKKPALANLATYRYDLADLCRQVLADRARASIKRCQQAFQSKNKEAFKKESAAFLRLMEQSSQILATSEHFLLGKYLEGAKNRGTTPEDKAAIEKSLRQLFTTWRPDTSVLNDYAHRQYAEMMQQYYMPRWKAYFAARERELDGKASADEVGHLDSESTSNNGELVERTQTKSASVDAIERAFPTAKLNLLVKPEGNPLKIASKILGGKP